MREFLPLYRWNLPRRIRGALKPPGRTGLAGLLFATFAASASAALTEPDNVLYGSIMVSNQPVTAAQTEYVVEASRTPGGPPLASYRMGANPGLGSFYSLQLKVESIAPLSDTNASELGDNVYIVLRDNAGIVAQTNFTFGDRGVIQRLDFGDPVDDVDGNGLPDVWEIAHLGGTGGIGGDADNDGQSDAAEYNAGTDPSDPNDAFRVNIGQTGAVVTVWFATRKAEGPGYEGLTRYYALQDGNALPAAGWSDVPGVSNVVGSGQVVTYLPSGLGDAQFYRARTFLSATPGSGSPLDLPDDWEIAYYGSPGQPLDSDTDMDGLTTVQEFIAGTNPTNASDNVRMAITWDGAVSSISVLARKAEGVGYAGITRRYTIERTADAAAGPWTDVAGFQNVEATNQTILLQTLATNAPALYRARIELQGW